jgi:hypothetical protein
LGDADWIRSAAAQLLRLSPDVILANGTLERSGGIGEICSVEVEEK